MAGRGAWEDSARDTPWRGITHERGALWALLRQYRFDAAIPPASRGVLGLDGRPAFPARADAINPGRPQLGASVRRPRRRWLFGIRPPVGEGSAQSGMERQWRCHRPS